MNYLGIDFGTKRMGLSVGDDELYLAVSIGTIRVIDLNSAIQQIKEKSTLHRIHKIIIGYPLNMDDSAGFQAKAVDVFIKILKKHIAIPIERVDERLTSKNVIDLQKRSPKNRQRLRQTGTIDSAAAVLILQDYLDALKQSPEIHQE